MKTYSKSGFTLIEILIVLSIIGVLLGTASVYLRGSDDYKSLEAEGKKFAETLNLASKKASSGDIGAGTCTGFLGYRVSVTATDYSTILRCSAGDTTIYSQKFGGSVSPSRLGDIDFQPLSAGATASCTRLNKSGYSDKCYCVNVQASGIIDSQNCSNCSSCP